MSMMIAEGSTASGVADDGRAPVKVGGVAAAVAPSYTAGQRAVLPISLSGEVFVRLRNGNGTDPVMTAPGDGVGNGNNALFTVGYTMLYNGLSWDRRRAPVIFKNIAGVAITAGTPVAIWTPAAGKKFRIMGIVLMSATAVRVAVLKDGGTEFLRTASPVIAGFQTLLGNGILSALANNVLTLDLSVSDTVHGFVFGTEE